VDQDAAPGGSGCVSITSPVIRITLTRGSVSMGDDTGGRRTWAVYLGFTFRTDSSRSLAVLNHHHVACLEDPNARLKDLAGDGAADLYFEYVLRDDPDTMRDRLLGGRNTGAAEDFGPARD